MLNTIHINHHNKVPKYKQLETEIKRAIAEGHLIINQKLPSVKKFSDKLELSRETVFKAFSLLSDQGIIKSVNRKGYYIQKVDMDVQYRILFILDKMTPFKECIYDGLRHNLPEKTEIEIAFHHGNIKLFKSYLSGHQENYTHFIISTFLKEEDPSVTDLLNSIPDGKLILIDNYEKNITINHSQIYQDFQNDIYTCLTTVLEAVKRYEKVVLVAPEMAPHRIPVIDGFKKFCEENEIPNSILEKEELNIMSKGHLYIFIGARDNNLVKIIKFSRDRGYKLGRDIGVISYNDTQMKEILEGGVTVISTDFFEMGKTASKVIKEGTNKIIRNPSDIIIRETL